MSESTASLHQSWTDILPLVTPPSLSWWLVVAGVVLLVLAVIVVAVLWQQRPRQRALRVLHRCRRQLRAVPADTRRIAHTVHRALLQGLGLHPASRTDNQRASDQQWQSFYDQLQRCAFQAVPPAADELAELIRQGRYWLHHHGKP